MQDQFSRLSASEWQAPAEAFFGACGLHGLRVVKSDSKNDAENVRPAKPDGGFAWWDDLSEEDQVWALICAEQNRETKRRRILAELDSPDAVSVRRVRRAEERAPKRWSPDVGGTYTQYLKWLEREMWAGRVKRGLHKALRRVGKPPEPLDAFLPMSLARRIVSGAERWPKALLPWKAYQEEIYYLASGPKPPWLSRGAARPETKAIKKFNPSDFSDRARLLKRKRR